MKRPLTAVWAALCAVLLLLCAPALAQERPIFRNGGPVVVELFTSQSCYNCYRANRLLGELSREQDILALTFPVDYWNYLGWRDTFARNDFTLRQRAYRRGIGLRGLLTPEVVVNGLRHSAARRDSDISALLDMFANAPVRQGPRIVLNRANGQTSLLVGAGAAPSEPADIWVASFDPGPVWQTVTGGANRGRRMPHYNLVRTLTRAGEWSGAQVSFPRIRCGRDCAVLVQSPNGGPILAAARTAPRR